MLLAFVGVALYGAGLSFTVISRLGGSETILRELFLYDYWIIFAGAIGAAAGLFIGRHHMGHAGLAGLRQAAFGACVVTFAATVCGGTLALPAYGTMFGPFAAVLTFWESPLLLAFWITILFASHQLIAIWRRERDSLFVFRDDGIPT